MRYLTITTAALVVAVALPASAQARDPYPNSAGTVCKSVMIKAHYSARYYRVKEAHGTRTPGRNIRRYGLNGHRKSKCKHLRRSSRTFKRWLAPPPAPVASGDTSSAVAAPATAAPAASTGGGSSNSMVDPSCESGGNSQVVDPSGTYWGKYQFDYGTWVAHGGDPGAYGSAPESVQDQIAGNVTYDAWPNC